MTFIEMLIAKFLTPHLSHKSWVDLCDRCGKNKATRRGLCPACAEDCEAPVLFI